MKLALEQKVALVSASSAGIGKAIAKGLAEEGAHVSIFSRTEGALKATHDEIAKVARGKVIYHVCDLSRKKDIEDVVSDTRTRLGPIDILVNNQGGPAPGGFDEVNEEQIASAVRVNLEAVIQLTRLCISDMKIRKWGRILNILSISGKEPIAGMFLSNVLRPAILGLSKTLASEAAGLGITVNSLLPSAVLTDRARGLIKRAAERQSIDFEKALADSSKSLPIGHLASPEEFAQLAIFLCSPKASYVTGTAIPVDGGFSRGLF